MFTGIVEEIGTIERVVSGARSGSLTICADKVLDDVHLGDSIAVNGTCLTVVDIKKSCFTADVMAETMRRTNLGTLVRGSHVNLERAMPLNGRFGGHIVSGHIDGVGTIISMRREENAVWVRISADGSVMKYIVEKGSVALDGISLTVAEVRADSFSVSVIPHTSKETTFLEHDVGYKINIECDIIGKYVEKLTRHSGITEDMLHKYGF